MNAQPATFNAERRIQGRHACASFQMRSFLW
jgi:hypothetical protein